MSKKRIDFYQEVMLKISPISVTPVKPDQGLVLFADTWVVGDYSEVNRHS